MFFVYILKSLKVARFYIGVTENVQNRVREHNRGNTKSTKPYKPWKVVYVEDYRSKKDAYKREYYLKHPKGYLEKCKILAPLM